MLKDLYDWTLKWAEAPNASTALFMISFAESSFFPIPPDLLLIPMCLAMPEQSFFYALICTVGSVLGGVFGFGVGKYGGRPVLMKLFKEDKILFVEKLYNKYDAWAIGIAGFSPIPYKVFSVSAGALKVSLKVLVLISFLSRGARFFLVAGLIYFFGAEIKSFIDDYFNLLTIGFTVLLVGGFFVIRFAVKEKKV